MIPPQGFVKYDPRRGNVKEWIYETEILLGLQSVQDIEGALGEIIEPAFATEIKKVVSGARSEYGIVVWRDVWTFMREFDKRFGSK